MKVLVTGAAGRLGSRVASLLEAAGHEVLAADREGGGPRQRPLHRLDLRDAEPWKHLLAGVNGVVHCAAARMDAPPRVILDTNVQGTLNLLHASLACGVRKFVFASTIQVLASEGKTDGEPAEVAYLPLDGESPPHPTNVYASTKAAGEIMVRTLFRGAGRESQSLRFPWLTHAVLDGPWGRRLEPAAPRVKRVVVEQGFSFLSYGDAARLIEACLDRSLPGHRVYLPALCAIPPEEVGRYVARYYPGVPLRRPLDQLSSLVDIDAIRADTGWSPRDRPPALANPQRRGWLRRILRSP